MKYLFIILTLLASCANPNNLNKDNMLTCTAYGHIVYNGPVEDVLLIGNAIAFTPLDGPQKGTRVTAVNINCISGTRN